MKISASRHSIASLNYSYFSYVADYDWNNMNNIKIEKLKFIYNNLND